MEYLNQITTAILLGTVFVACTKTHQSPVPPGGPGVYVSGTQRKTGGINQAVYWKNGSLVELSKNIESTATNIVVSGNDVYIAGKLGSSVGYWKNGIFDSLGEDENTYVQIAVFGNDVYLATSSEIGTTYYSGVYKNDIYTATVPGPGKHNPGLTSIAVGDQGILLGGFETDSTDGIYGGIATYWLNNVDHPLTDKSKYVNVNGVAFGQTDIYAAGTETIRNTMGKLHDAQCWKNDTDSIVLGNVNSNNAASGVAVSGQDVYVSGGTQVFPVWGHEIAKYWKNNVEYALTDSLSDCYAAAITVVGSDVYVVVYDVTTQPLAWQVAKYFKNGKEVDLTDGSFYSTASGIYVQQN